MNIQNFKKFCYIPEKVIINFPDRKTSSFDENKSIFMLLQKNNF